MVRLEVKNPAETISEKILGVCYIVSSLCAQTRGLLGTSPVCGMSLGIETDGGLKFSILVLSHR